MQAPQDKTIKNLTTSGLRRPPTNALFIRSYLRDNAEAIAKEVLFKNSKGAVAKMLSISTFSVDVALYYSSRKDLCASSTIRRMGEEPDKAGPKKQDRRIPDSFRGQIFGGRGRGNKSETLTDVIEKLPPVIDVSPLRLVPPSSTVILWNEMLTSPKGRELVLDAITTLVHKLDLAEQEIKAREETISTLKKQLFSSG